MESGRSGERFGVVLAVLGWILAGVAARGAPGEAASSGDLLWHRAQAAAAREQGEPRGELAHLAAAWALAPDHPVLVRDLARAQLEAGNLHLAAGLLAGVASRRHVHVYRAGDAVSRLCRLPRGMGWTPLMAGGRRAFHPRAVAWEENAGGNVPLRMSADGRKRNCTGPPPRASFPAAFPRAQLPLISSP